MKKLFLCFFLLIAFAQPSFAEEPIPASEFLKSSIDGVVTTLKNDPEMLKNYERMENYVSENILSQFDMTLLSKSIVGEPIWAKASLEEQANLTGEMTVFFRHLIAKTLSEYDNQTLAFDDETQSSDNERAAIKGRLLDKKDETIAFNFRLIKSASGWKIYDVNLGGVDLIYTYRSNFKSTLEAGGVARLAEELHKKNLTVAAIKK
jgi:phospholipid transport system substrate-binding protein